MHPKGKPLNMPTSSQRNKWLGSPVYRVQLKKESGQFLPHSAFRSLDDLCKPTCERNSAHVEPRKGVGSGEAIHKGVQNTS